MNLIDYSLRSQHYQAAARRERSHYVHCLLVRAWQWLLSLVPERRAGARGLAAQPA